MKDFYNIYEFKAKAEKVLLEESYEYLKGGAEDERTLQRNISEYQSFQIRPRRLIDVTNANTSVNILGEIWKSPLFYVPLEHKVFSIKMEKKQALVLLTRWIT